MVKAVNKDEAILGMRTYKLLGDLQARQALGHLQERLDEEVASQHAWRRKRDAPEKQVRPVPDTREPAPFKPQ